MREFRMGPPQLVAIAVTRGLLGLGLGLLLAGRLSRDRRRAVGATLAIIGGLSTIPLALGVLPRLRATKAETDHGRVDHMPAKRPSASSITAS